ncbi:MAG: hypothetical protein AAF480_20200 [Actinomycetota bacterium]
MTDWTDLSARASVAVHRLVGWIFWDPAGVAALEARGVPDGMGYYVVTRAAPLLPAGPKAVAASYYSINPAFIEMVVTQFDRHAEPSDAWEVRNDAVAAGLREHTPEICDDLAAMGPALWAVVEQLPISGRVLFAAHVGAPRHDDPLVSAWLAVNCLREWRGDTHWGLLLAEGIDGVQAGLLEDAHRDYGGWIAQSRGADETAIPAAMAGLEARGLAEGGRVNDAGLALRRRIEERTDQLTEPPWRLLGADSSEAFVALVGSAADVLVGRIDETAGAEWLPAVRGASS